MISLSDLLSVSDTVPISSKMAVLWLVEFLNPLNQIMELHVCVSFS